MAGELSPDEVLEFLFLPGFSTAAHVTDISGRGVGLDVVQAMVHASRRLRAGGHGRGEGTTFSLHLPVTRSVLRCLLVRIGGEPFALPLSHVDRLLRIVTGGAAWPWRVGHAYGWTSDRGLVSGCRSWVWRTSSRRTASCTSSCWPIGDRHGLEVEAFLGERDLVVRTLIAAGRRCRTCWPRPSGRRHPHLILDPDDLVAPSTSTWAMTGRRRSQPADHGHGAAEGAHPGVDIPDRARGGAAAAGGAGLPGGGRGGRRGGLERLRLGGTTCC